MVRRTALISLLATGLVAQALPQEDPVMRARAQRTATSGDLPPVPRGVVEPPPLPPPETHPKDLKGARRVKGGKGAKARKGAPKGKTGKKGVRKAPRGGSKAR